MLYKGTEPETARSDLVDIRDVAVNKELPREERVADFVRQIKDPYHFNCGKFLVKVSFAEAGGTIEDCIKGLIT